MGRDSELKKHGGILTLLGVLRDQNVWAHKILISQLIFDLAQNDKIVASMDTDIYDKPTPYFEGN
jgi:hypothetical protein